MANPFSDGVLGIFAFIKEHPGVQAKYIAAELNIKGKDLEIALTIVQGRGLGRRKGRSHVHQITAC
jgi:predicted transcriptional regulator